jgi:hypothetical protein
MTLNEAREVLRGATWAHETSSVVLLDELVKRYDEPVVDRGTGKQYPGKITRAFTDYERSCVASGRVVQLLISLRQQNGIPLYALQT